MSYHAKDVADFLLQGLTKGLEMRGRAVLVVSGGSSPVPIFEQLTQMDFAWDNTIITLVDERDVPASHPDSNHRLVQETLLQGKAAKATFIPLHNNAAAQDQIGQADSLLLGMGMDGHFASLFPVMIGQEEAFDVSATPQIIKTAPMGSPIHPRISMNMALIATIPHKCLILPNEEKAAFYNAAIQDETKPVYYLHRDLGDSLTLFA